jgi:hypothetical protein
VTIGACLLVVFTVLLLAWAVRAQRARHPQSPPGIYHVPVGRPRHRMTLSRDRRKAIYSAVWPYQERRVLLARPAFLARSAGTVPRLASLHPTVRTVRP